MYTEPRVADLAPQTKGMSRNLRLFNWLSFWLQLALGAAAILTLVFAITGRRFTQGYEPIAPGLGLTPLAQGTTPGIGIGIFWAVCALIVLLFNLYLAFRLTRLGKRLRHPNPALRPQLFQVRQILKLGVVMGLVGVLLALLGEGTTLGILLAKSVAQPQGVAIYDPTRIIRSLDIFVAIANMNGLTANFIAAVTPLGLLNSLPRY